MHQNEVLICQQIDDAAIAVDKVSTADSLFAILEKKRHVLTRHTNSLQRSRNIPATRIHQNPCNAIPYKILKGHGWDKPAPDEKGKQPIEPIHPRSFKELEQTKGPVSNDTKEQAMLRKNIGCGYRQRIGELC